MADDVKRNLERQYQKGIQVDMDIVFRRNLMLMEDLIFVKYGHGLKLYGLSTLSYDSPNRELMREVAYYVVPLSEIVNTNGPKINFEQRQVYNTLLTSVNSTQGQQFIVG